jgi:hypothetical protein
MSRKKNKSLGVKAKHVVNKFKVEAAKELGIGLEDVNAVESSPSVNEPVDESMYVRIVRSFKKF